MNENQALMDKPGTSRTAAETHSPAANREAPPAKPEDPKPMYGMGRLAAMAKLNEHAPDAMKAFWAFDKIAVAAGAIPVKTKELIAVAVAVTTQCPYCIEIHSANARKAGATDAEIVEATIVAASLRAGGAITHATHALAV